MPDFFDDGEPSTEDFALPGDEAYNPASIEETPVAVADEPTPAEPADTEGEQEAVEPELAPAAEVEPEPTDDRPRDEQGRFLPRNIEIDDPLTQEYLAKYGGDPAAALKAAANQTDLIGRQGEELGRYRQWYEQQQAQQPQPQVQQPLDISALQERLYENTHEIIPTIQQAHAAALQGNPQAARVRDAALAAMREIDGVAAEGWAREIAVSEMRTQQQSHESAQTQQQTAWNQTIAGLEQELPRINELAPTIMEIAQQPQFGAALEVLQSGNPDARAWAIRTLYREAEAQKGRQNADTLSRTAAQIAKEQAQEAERAIAEASVASASTAVPTRELSPKERDQLETFAVWDAEEKKYSDGWNI